MKRLFNKKYNKGQVMLLSVMILGGIMVSAATIGSILTRYQVRQVNDALNSAKAFFAADTAIELVSWCRFKTCPPDTYENPPQILFEDSAVTYAATTTLSGDGVFTIFSQGISRKTVRVLEAAFIQ